VPDQVLGLAAAIVVAALLLSALGLAAALYFLGRLRLPRLHRDGVVTLILPLTGNAPNLESLLRALEAQTLRPRRLIVSVESTRDPAYRRVSGLARGLVFPLELVVAGLAEGCAQKSLNLIAALARIDAQDQAVVLLDADILPAPWWLSALVTPLLDGSSDLVNGYRWPVPAAPRVGAQLAASIDRAIALLPRPGRFALTWGGSLALSPQALRALALDRTLASTLSDDCSIGEQAAALGLRVLNRRALLVPTPTAAGLASTWRFGRRQYQIIRIYRPSLWGLAFSALSTRLLAWLLLLTHLGQTEGRLAAGALVIFALAGAITQNRVGRRLGAPDGPGTAMAQGLLAVLKPAVDLFHWTLVAAAFSARTVHWGHVSYSVAGPTDVLVRRRVPWS